MSSTVRPDLSCLNTKHPRSDNLRNVLSPQTVSFLFGRAPAARPIRFHLWSAGFQRGLGPIERRISRAYGEREMAGIRFIPRGHNATLMKRYDRLFPARIIAGHQKDQPMPGARSPLGVSSQRRDSHFTERPLRAASISASSFASSTAARLLFDLHHLELRAQFHLGRKLIANRSRRRHVRLEFQFAKAIKPAANGSASRSKVSGVVGLN